MKLQMNSIKVPFVDLKQRYEAEKEEILQCIDRVLSKGHLVMTPELSNFEEEVCNYTGSKHCIGLNSGTDALMMGLMTAGVKKNDEVITSPISFVATTAISHIGAKPVYVDTKDDLNIDPNLIEKAITKETKAIVPVHWAGKIADMTQLWIYPLNIIYQLLRILLKLWDPFIKTNTAVHLVFLVLYHVILKNLNALGDGVYYY